jgi:hypothetical protein
MGRGNLQHLNLIPSAGDDYAVSHNDSADGDLVSHGRLVGTAQGGLHVKDIRLPVEALDFVRGHRRLGP